MLRPTLQRHWTMFVGASCGGFARSLGSVLVLQEGPPPGSTSGVLSFSLTSWVTFPWKPQGWHFLMWFPVLPRICFPVQVSRLLRETLLSATLYALPIPPPGSSSEANKQRRVPEVLGWVTAPLFNFRQYVSPGQHFGLEREEGMERGGLAAAGLAGAALKG